MDLLISYEYRRILRRRYVALEHRKMGNLHTRTCSFHSGGGVAHTVLLRHHVATGKRELVIDTVPATTGNVATNAMDTGHTWTETVGGQILVVKIATNFWASALRFASRRCPCVPLNRNSPALTGVTFLQHRAASITALPSTA